MERLDADLLTTPTKERIDAFCLKLTERLNSIWRHLAYFHLLFALQKQQAGLTLEFVFSRSVASSALEEPARMNVSFPGEEGLKNQLGAWRSYEKLSHMLTHIHDGTLNRVVQSFASLLGSVPLADADAESEPQTPRSHRIEEVTKGREPLVSAMKHKRSAREHRSRSRACSTEAVAGNGRTDAEHEEVQKEDRAVRPRRGKSPPLRPASSRAPQAGIRWRSPRLAGLPAGESPWASSAQVGMEPSRFPPKSDAQPEHPKSDGKVRREPSCEQRAEWAHAGSSSGGGPHLLGRRQHQRHHKMPSTPPQESLELRESDFPRKHQL